MSNPANDITASAYTKTVTGARTKVDNSAKVCDLKVDPRINIDSDKRPVSDYTKTAVPYKKAYKSNNPNAFQGITTSVDPANVPVSAYTKKVGK